MSDGIADFSEGRYYDRFSGPEALSPDNLRGLENECEGARIQDFYLPLLSRRPRGSAPIANCAFWTPDAETANRSMC